MENTTKHCQVTDLTLFVFRSDHSELAEEDFSISDGSRMIESIGRDLWEVNRSLNLPGLNMDHRMTVVRMATGRLLLHSPVAWNPALAGALADLGEVETILAPSTFHDLYLSDWLVKYPAARFLAAPGVGKEHPDWRVDETIGNHTFAASEGELEACVFKGVPKLNESVFLHRPTRSLIVADLAFNVGTRQNPLARLFLRANGIYGKIASSRVFRLFIRDRAAFRDSLDEVLDWDFDRLIVGHGRIVETSGREALREAYAWLSSEHDAGKQSPSA